MISYTYGPNSQPLTYTFDLGLDRLLDVTFHTVNSTGAILPAHIGHANTGTISATFLLRDVPDAVPEPGTLLLAGGMRAAPVSAARPSAAAPPRSYPRPCRHRRSA